MKEGVGESSLCFGSLVVIADVRLFEVESGLDIAESLSRRSGADQAACDILSIVLLKLHEVGEIESCIQFGRPDSGAAYEELLFLIGEIMDRSERFISNAQSIVTRIDGASAALEVQGGVRLSDPGLSAVMKRMKLSYGYDVLLGADAVEGLARRLAAGIPDVGVTGCYESGLASLIGSVRESNALYRNLDGSESFILPYMGFEERLAQAMNRVFSAADALNLPEAPSGRDFFNWKD